MHFLRNELEWLWKLGDADIFYYYCCDDSNDVVVSSESAGSVVADCRVRHDNSTERNESNSPPWPLFLVIGIRLILLFSYTLYFVNF